MDTQGILLLVKLIYKILLCKRAVIESVNDHLKKLCQIEHSHHHSIFNFLVNLMAGERCLYLSAAKTIPRYFVQVATQQRSLTLEAVRAMNRLASL